MHNGRFCLTITSSRISGFMTSERLALMSSSFFCGLNAAIAYYCVAMREGRIRQRHTTFVVQKIIVRPEEPEWLIGIAILISLDCDRFVGFSRAISASSNHG